MKRMYIVLSAFLLLFTFTACEDKRLTGMVDDHVFLLESGIRILELERTEAIDYKMVVYKSGMGTARGKVKILIDETVLNEFNSYSEKKYLMLPEACYNLREIEAVFLKETVSEIIPITLDGGAIYLLQGRLTTDYAIPIRIEPVDGINIDAGESSVLIIPKVVR